MRFTAIDVETANADMASICAAGIATFEGDRLAAEWRSLVDPRDYFDGMNMAVHGIGPSAVVGAPTWRDVSPVIAEMLRGAVVVTHTHFDRVATHQAAQRWAVKPPVCTWLDSAKVARRTWADCAYSGYGLAKVCELIGYEFQHHDALEDAKAAGHVVLAAMRKSGLDLDGLLRRVSQPIDLDSVRSGSGIRREGNPEGPLFGEVAVFTGAIGMPRNRAADLAASLGCEVAPSVTKKTTLLIVGDQDIKRLAGHEKSSKHRKAEELAAQGWPIRIIGESDFHALASVA